MATSQRVSRGFHRLAIFLAGVPLIVGVAWSVLSAMGDANRARGTHDQLLCAQQKIQQADKQLARRKTGKTITYEQATGTTDASQQPTPHLDELLRQPPPENNLQAPPPQTKKRLLSDEEIGVVASQNQTRLEENPFWLLFAPDDARLNLKKIGCSNWDFETVSFGEARNPPKLEWLSVFVPPAAWGLAITLGISLAVYGLVRAIGWVIGGFAGS